MRRSLSKKILNEIRQWCYPPEFRIPSDAVGDDDDKINDLIQSLSQTLKVFANPEFQTRLRNQTAIDDEPFIADLATRLWRIRQNLKRPDSEEPIEEIERGYRHLERLFSNLEQLEIRVVDKTGDAYDPGMALKVVSSEPMEGIGREIIKETIEPAIYKGDRLIQTSQVVVGIPSMRGSTPMTPPQPVVEPEGEPNQEPDLTNISKKEPDGTFHKPE